MSISVLALVISLGLLGWEFTRWALEGARVRVILQAGHLHDHVLYQASTWDNLKRMVDLQNVGGWPVEVAVIDVENAGRTAVTISDVSFDLGRTRSRIFGVGRHTIGMRLLDAPGASQERIVRIEPLDRARFVIEAWSVLPAVRERQPSKGPVAPIGRVRASVKVAGRRRRRRSPWRKAWRSRPGAVSHTPGPVDLKLAAYRVLWAHTHGGQAMDEHTEMHVIPFALAIGKKFPPDGPAPTSDQLEELFKLEWVFRSGENKEPIGLGLLGYYVAQDLQMFYPEHDAANVETAPHHDAGPG